MIKCATALNHNMVATMWNLSRNSINIENLSIIKFFPINPLAKFHTLHYKLFLKTRTLHKKDITTIFKISRHKTKSQVEACNFDKKGDTKILKNYF